MGIAYLCVMNKIERIKAAKISKKIIGNEVFHYEDGTIRVKYKIKSIIPDKTDNIYTSYDIKLGLEVISLEKSVYLRDEVTRRLLRDENNELVRDFRKYVADKRFAHNHNYKLRSNARDHIVFKALGIREYNIKVGTIKWNVQQ